MTDFDSDIDRLNQEFAHRLRGLGEMFSDLGTAEGADRLLDTLVADDAGAFHELIDHYDLPDFPKIGLCVWVREVLDSVLLNPNVTEQCRLRSRLTPFERRRVLAIAAKHRILMAEPLAGQAIAPGEFLDELKESGLVQCDPIPSHSRPLILLGPYEHFCV